MDLHRLRGGWNRSGDREHDSTTTSFKKQRAAHGGRVMWGASANQRARSPQVMISKERLFGGGRRYVCTAALVVRFRYTCRKAKDCAVSSHQECWVSSWQIYRCLLNVLIVMRGRSPTVTDTVGSKRAKVVAYVLKSTRMCVRLARLEHEQ